VTVPLLLVAEVRKRLKGHTRLTKKNQATIPVDVLREAGIKAGDLVRARAVGSGRVELERVDDPIGRYAGALPGAYPPGWLEQLRSEWPE